MLQADEAESKPIGAMPLYCGCEGDITDPDCEPGTFHIYATMTGEITLVCAHCNETQEDCF